MAGADTFTMPSGVAACRGPAEATRTASGRMLRDMDRISVLRRVVGRRPGRMMSGRAVCATKGGPTVDDWGNRCARRRGHGPIHLQVQVVRMFTNPPRDRRTDGRHHILGLSRPKRVT